MEPFIGIDLGTTNSVVACIDSMGTPQAIKNEFGMTITPSVVYFGPDGPIVGLDAKQKQSDGEGNVAAFFKRQMGNPNFVLELNGNHYTPVDLSSFILKKLRQIAESFLGKKVTQAVITVPAYFNNPPRSDTIRAAEMAGLNVLGIIAEPTAAALAYGIRLTQQDQIVMVYDLGGGTFDVSIVKISQTEQVVICTCGDYTLGGKDWDDRITQYFVDAFEQEFATDLSEESYNYIAGQAEEMKKKLGSLPIVQLRVDAKGHIGNYSLTREKFEEITSDLIELTRMLTQKAINDSGLAWDQIDHTLLVGGSTRMPAVIRCIEEMSGKPPLASINRDESVALGAAIQAAMLMEKFYPDPEIPMMRLVGRKLSTDVMSHSLGMIAINDSGTKYLNSILIKRNLPIPCTQTKLFNFKLNKNKDNRLEVFLTQGESGVPSEVVFLGRYVFSGFPTQCDENVVVEVNYSYNSNGVVEVQAVEQATKIPLALTVEDLPDDVPDRFMVSPQMRKEHLTIYLAFDLSGSMEGAPLNEAKKAAHSFLNQFDLGVTSVGIIGFSDRVRLYTTASNDKSIIERAINAMNCGDTGFCNGTDPFYELLKQFEIVNGLRYAIILADGVWENQARAIKIAQKCHEAGIEVIGVGFGDADSKFLKAISSSDQTSFFTDLSKLVETFSTIAQEISDKRLSEINGILSLN